MDISKVVAKVQDYANRMNAILPRHWKGNIEPNAHHFDADSIHPSVGLDAANRIARFGFDFTDDGVPHRIEAVLPLDEHTLEEWDAQVTLDGVEQPHGRVAFGHREGLEGFTLYARLVVWFRFMGPDGPDVSYRFDGDLAA